MAETHFHIKALQPVISDCLREHGSIYTIKSANRSLFHSCHVRAKGNEALIASGVFTVHFIGQANLHITACDAAISDGCCRGNSPPALATGITAVSELQVDVGSCTQLVRGIYRNTSSQDTLGVAKHG